MLASECLGFQVDSLELQASEDGMLSRHVLHSDTDYGIRQKLLYA